MRKSPILVIVLALILSSCGYETSRKIIDVSNYIQETPDSALRVLESIDLSSIRSRKVSARYSLLYAMAIDKNYIDTTEESIIMPAVEYYEKHGTYLDKAISLYYLGRIRQNSKDFSTAVVTFKRAYSILEEYCEPFWKGMVSAAIGATYGSTFDSVEQLEWNQIAYHCFQEAGDSSHLLIAARALALACHNDKQYERCDSILSFLIQRDSTDVYSLLIFADSQIKREEPNVPNVLDVFERAIRNGAGMSLTNYYEYAYALRLIGREGDSQKLINKLSQYPDDVNTYYWKWKINYASGNLAEAFSYRDSCSKYENQVVRMQLSQSVSKAEAEYYKINEENIKIKQSQISLRLCLLILSIILLSVAILFYYYKQKKVLDLEMKDLELQIEQSKKLISLLNNQKEESDKEKDTTIEYYQKLFVNSYREQFREISRLFEINKDVESMQTAFRREYIEKISDIMSEIREGGKKQKAFEARLDKDLDGIMSKLRKDYPSFKEQDFRFLSLEVAGFDATTKSFILDESANKMRVKKHRLKNFIIKEHPTENIKLYSICLFK